MGEPITCKLRLTQYVIEVRAVKTAGIPTVRLSSRDTDAHSAMWRYSGHAVALQVAPLCPRPLSDEHVAKRVESHPNNVKKRRLVPHRD